MTTSLHKSDRARSSPFAADRREGSRAGNRNVMAYSTPLTIWETDDKIQVEIDLPGLTPEAIDLNFKDGMLWIRGERAFSRHAQQEGQMRYNDRFYGPFERVVKLPDLIDPASIEAEFANGVLAVSLAKRPEAQPHKVKVRAG